MVDVNDDQIMSLCGIFYLNSEQLRLSSETFRKPSLRKIRSFIVSLIRLFPLQSQNHLTQKLKIKYLISVLIMLKIQ